MIKITAIEHITINITNITLNLYTKTYISSILKTNAQNNSENSDILKLKIIHIIIILNIVIILIVTIHSFIILFEHCNKISFLLVHININISLNAHFT